MQRLTRTIFALILASGSTTLADVFPDDLADLFAERVRSVVVVEYVIQFEVDRRSAETIGLIVDDEGLIVLGESAVPNWLPPDQLRDFRIFQPGIEGDGVPAEYLGPDGLNGWFYVRTDPEQLENARSIRSFAATDPELGMPVWGVALLPKDFDYAPYLLDGRVAIVRPIPLRTAISERYVAAPGSAVFNADGAFVGWAQDPLSEDKILIRGRDSTPVALRDPRQTQAFLAASEFLPNLGRLPESPAGDPRPWVGVSGMQPIDRDVARFLGLSGRGAVVVSEVLEDTPADRAGLRDKDIIVAVDGEPLPNFRPDGITQAYFERQVMRHQPGDTITFDVVREDSQLTVAVETVPGPTTLAQAERRYFNEIGVTIREFLLNDAIPRRVSIAEADGVVTSFVKPNSPVSTAGLRAGDWIREIDGRPVAGWEEAVDRLETIEDDDSRSEFVMLVDRSDSTTVLRVKLD